MKMTAWTLARQAASLMRLSTSRSAGLIQRRRHHHEQAGGGGNHHDNAHHHNHHGHPHHHCLPAMNEARL